MKKTYLTPLMLIVSMMFLIGCGPGSSTEKSKGKKTTLVKQIAIDPIKESTILIEGMNGDNIELRVAKNTLFGQGTDPIDINITLTYLGDTLTGFSVNKDLVFAKPLYIAFDVDTLKDNERFLEYIHASDASKNYFLPFTVDGSSIVYEFSHFSAYVFRPNDVADKINVVALRLQALKNATDKKGGLKSIEQQINEVYNLISIIDLNDSSAATTLQADANDVSIAYGTAFIEETSYTGSFLDGNCMHADLTKYINELIFNGSVIAALGASENSLSKSVTYLKQTADAFLDTNPTQLCKSVSGMSDYASCGVDIAAKLVALGDSSGKDSLVLSHIEEKVLASAETAATQPCGKTCVEKAIDFGASFFSAATLSKLDVVLGHAQDCSITLTIGTVEETSISLLWAATEHSPAGYNLYYAKESFGNPADVTNYSSLDGGGVKTLNNTNYTLTGLTKDTVYYFVVASVNNKSKEIGLSTEKTARTKGGNNFSVTERRINSIYGEWSVADVVWSLGNTKLENEPDSYVVYASNTSYGTPVVVDKLIADSMYISPSVDVQEGDASGDGLRVNYTNAEGVYHHRISVPGEGDMYVVLMSVDAAGNESLLFYEEMVNLEEADIPGGGGSDLSCVLYPGDPYLCPY